MWMVDSGRRPTVVRASSAGETIAHLRVGTIRTFISGVGKLLVVCEWFSVGNGQDIKAA